MPKVIRNGDIELREPSNLLSVIRPGNGTGYYSDDDYHQLQIWTKLNADPPEVVISKPDPFLDVEFNGTVDFSEVGVGERNNIFDVANFSNANNTTLDFNLSLNNIIAGTATTDLPFSISMWFKFDTATLTNDILFYTDTTAGFPTLEISYNNVSNKFKVEALDNNTGDGLYYRTDELDRSNFGSLTHLVVTYDGLGTTNSFKFYLDGVEQGKESINSGAFNAMQPDITTFKLGEIDGSISEFAIFSKMLSRSAVEAIYNGSIYYSLDLTSGFISLPPRVLTRQFDSATGSYPTTLRTGDVNRRGNYQVSFDDTNTVLFENSFGKALIDFGFELTDPVEALNPRQGDSITLTDGSGQSYEFTFKPASVVEDIINEYGSIEEYYLINGSNPRVVSFPVFISDRLTLAQNFIKEVEKVLKIKGSVTKIVRDTNFKSVVVELKQQIPGVVGNTTIEKSLQADVITFPGGIQIERFYGLSLPGSFSGGSALSVNRTTNLPSSATRLQRQAYASPNILETQLDGSGSVVAGVADSHIRFTPGEDLTPFTDSRINLGTSLFYQQGTPESVYRGFSSRLADKTQITVDLSPSSPTEFGYKRNLTAASPVNDTSGNGQILMVYWNNVQKKWEEIGQPVYANTVSSPTPDTMINMITGACVGFAPASTVLTTGSDNDAYDNTLLNAAYLKSLGKPIDSFGFPFSAQYHATASQYIKARDLGILHPFILEKATVQFDAKLGIQHNATIHGSNQNNLLSPFVSFKNGTNPSQESRDVRVRVINPNFFLLRQKRNILNTNIDFCDPRTDGNEINFNFEIPRNQIIQSGSSESIYVDKSRELIGYGQMMIISSQSATSGNPLGNHTIQDLLNAGLSRDLNVSLSDIAEYTGNFTSLTGSFKMDFSAQTNARRQKVHQFRYKEQGIAQNVGRLQNQFGGRSTEDLDNANRALTNGFGALTRTDSFLLPGPNASSVPSGSFLPDENTLEKVSPYLIMPDDELVFGWQYPLHDNILNANVGSGDTPFYTMTLFDKSQLTLYGSLVKDNKEFHDTLNQPLTSQAVHEAIHHNNTVLDQFEVEDDTQYIGTYLDDYFEGKNTVLDPSSRLGLSVSSIVEDGDISLDNDSFQRNVTLFDRAKTYYDSYLPDFEKHFSRLAGERFTSSSIEVYYNFNDTSGGGNSVTTTINEPVPVGAGVQSGAVNRYIFKDSVGGSYDLNSFKAAPSTEMSVGQYLGTGPISIKNRLTKTVRYKGVPGFVRTIKSLFSNPYSYDPNRQISSKKDFQIVVQQVATASALWYSGTTDAETGWSFFSGSLPKIRFVNRDNLINLLGGRIDNFTSNFNDDIPFFNKSTNLGYYTRDSQIVPETDLIGNATGNSGLVITSSYSNKSLGLPEGYALNPYGMINLTPLIHNYVFRGSTYGQFADLVYASPNTKFVDFKNFSKRNDSKRSKAKVTSAAVNVTFVTGSRSTSLPVRSFRRVTPAMQITSEPYFQSSNISTECTSSLPFYDDDVPRNRTYPDIFVDVV